VFVLAHPDYLRDKARQLRVSKKLTIDELADRLALSRSTIYYWVRDLPIPGSGPGGEFTQAARPMGNRAMQGKYRRLREEAYAEGRQGFARLACDATFRDFVCLYMAEGSKRSRNRVAICNSDPAIVQLANRWIRRFARNPVTYSIQYHVDQDVRAIVEWWGGQLGVEPGSIRLQRKSNSNRLNGRNWRSPYGVLTVTTNDTLFHARLQAWMDCLREIWV
jgi:excisionase family DNA binding protein